MTKVFKNEPGVDYRWEHGEHSGSLRYAEDERGPAVIEWDATAVPDEWEEVERMVLDAAVKWTAVEEETIDGEKVWHWMWYRNGEHVAGGYAATEEDAAGDLEFFMDARAHLGRANR